MLKGFKEFVLRGNLIELAVAFVIGAAFAKVVQDFVGAIVTPLVNSIPGSKVNGFGFALRHGKDFTAANGTNTTFINLSTVINSLIVFVSTAAVVYFALVLPMNRIQERRALRTAKGEPDPNPKPEDVQLLEQIRDLLVAQQASASPSPRPRP